ncbi:hypothetical protein [Marmoricola sp. RAF53]|uniref:hypothetical protein n=1 Tax=Marmoricola sp. RAF53 TaxID=3233059 RepID=UPI003F9D22B1
MLPLRPPYLLALFTLGFGAGLLGDHFHVATGTTRYFASAHQVPFLADSPLWFALAVGGATAGIAAMRAALPDVRTALDHRSAIGGVASVLALYALTAFLRGTPTALSTTMVSALAVIIWCVLGDRTSLRFGALAAVAGPVAEIVLARAGLFAYAADSDELGGVALWLPGLYFAFGIVAALLGELAATHADRSRPESTATA